MVPWEKSKIVSSTSSRIGKIVAACSKLPVKLISYINFVSASNACYLLKRVVIIYLK